MRIAFLYGVAVLLLLFRISQEESAYQTPDSLLYLLMADSLGAPTAYQPHAGAAQLYPFKVEEVPVSLFPFGYPVLIRSIHELTGLALLQASKVLNLLLLAGCFWCFLKRYGKNSWMPLALFFGGTMLLVFSSTLSEAPFVLFLLLWVEQYHKFISNNTPAASTMMLLLVLSAALFLCRYAGIFLLPVYGILFLYYAIKGKRNKAMATVGIALAFFAVVLAYFTLNYYTTGFMAGISRVTPEPWKYVVAVILDASLNEVFFYKRWYFIFNHVEPGFIAAALVQVGILLAFFLSLRNRASVWRRIITHPLWLPAVVFYLTITCLRIFSPFLYDYRTLMPLELLVWLLLWDSILAEQAVTKQLQAVMAIAIVMGVVLGALYV